MPLTDPGPTEVRKQKSAADLQMESLDEPSGIVCVCVWVGWFNGIYLLPGLRNHDCRVLLHTFWLRDWGWGRKKCWCDNYSYCLAGLGVGTEDPPRLPLVLPASSTWGWRTPKVLPSLPLSQWQLAHLEFQMVLCLFYC